VRLSSGFNIWRGCGSSKSARVDSKQSEIVSGGFHVSDNYAAYTPSALDNLCRPKTSLEGHAIFAIINLHQFPAKAPVILNLTKDEAALSTVLIGALR
jgi:hypothetical protein